MDNIINIKNFPLSARTLSTALISIREQKGKHPKNKTREAKRQGCETLVPTNDVFIKIWKTVLSLSSFLFTLFITSKSFSRICLFCLPSVVLSNFENEICTYLKWKKLTTIEPLNFIWFVESKYLIKEVNNRTEQDLTTKFCL